MVFFLLFSQGDEMGGFFGVVSKQECLTDLFYGTDYHSHLGTMRGGLAVLGEKGFTRVIHDITTTAFRSKFEPDLPRFQGRAGIGIISDYEDQPLVIASHLGQFAIVTVGVITNLPALVQELYMRRPVQFSEMSIGGVNPTELVATLINTQDSFAAGIRYAQERIQGSCSMLVLTETGDLYAARDRYGRTPVILGEKEGAFAVAFETCSFSNLDYRVRRDLGPGEVVRLTAEGEETCLPPGPEMAICAFLWVYYGYPASSYEGQCVEKVRYRCGESLARRDAGKFQADMVAGVPDSGVGHALGYARAAAVPYARPFVKYTPTWPRSFMPQKQDHRELIARMKLIPVPDLIRGQRIVFCDDSIVRGTQLRDQVHRLYDDGASEIHMRIACPPLLFGCRFLNFSRSRSEMDLAARRAIKELEGDAADIDSYRDPDGAHYASMVERIQKRLGLASLRYQRLDDLRAAIGVPSEKICTFCWSGRDISCKGCTGGCDKS
jgi:amidophosphoribosyltransferase